MSNLLSNQNIENQIVASNGHNLPTKKVLYEGDVCWAYILYNIRNYKWYVGISTEHPNDYQTSSNNKELLSAISKGEIVRCIFEVGSNFSQMKVLESDLIRDTNAVNDPNSYNLGPGIVAKDIIREPNLDKMSDIAKQILNDRSLFGCKFHSIDLMNHKDVKNDKGYFLDSSMLKNLVSFQIREKTLNYDHGNTMIEKIDAALGQLKLIEEQSGQKFLVIILRDIEYEGKIIDLIIGGNHTIYAIEKSKYGFELPVLDIPKNVHSDWTMEEIRALGEYLNPINSVVRLETSEEDLIKTCLEFANKFGPETDVIGKHLDKHGIVGKQRSRIKSNVTVKYKKQKEEQETPTNFITYEDSNDKRIQTVVNEKKKEEHTLVHPISSGKLSVGDVVQRLVKKVKDDKMNYKRIHLVVYHPTNTTKKNFDDQWVEMINAWDWAVDKSKIESITYEEMPHLQEEIK